MRTDFGSALITNLTGLARYAHYIDVIQVSFDAVPWLDGYRIRVCYVSEFPELSALSPRWCDHYISGLEIESRTDGRRASVMYRMADLLTQIQADELDARDTMRAYLGRLDD